MSGFPSTGYGETFSGREKEILGLIAEGFSNHTIAQKLYLSLATVKWYNKQIYGKLGVSSRTQAVARAREVGLFASGVPLIPQQESRPKHNLPAALTSYIGREKELEDLIKLLRSRSVRLVTIIGAGGVGKTRLALQVAEEALPAFPHGAWLVDLSALSDPALVAQYVTSTLGWRGKAGIPYEELLIRVLKPRNLLLLLDGCEHLVEACAHLAASLLKACPHLVILATSREALEVEGEALYPLGMMAFPDPNHLLPPEVLQQYEAVQLFCERAALVYPGFTITQENALSVAQLCQRLDGMPLALELAAARANLFSPSQMVDWLDTHLWALTASTRAPLPRHRSLRACLDWSYALLSSAERLLLHRLAVFVGGWTLEAAEAVCSGGSGEPLLAGPLEPAVILDLLSRLVSKSLVVASLEGGPKPGQKMRYRMLDTLRQYAHERLVEAGEELFLRDRHLEYYTHFAEQVAPRLKSAEQAERLIQLEAERENLSAAMCWALVECDSGQEAVLARVDKGLRLGNALVYYWELSSLFQGVSTWLVNGLARIDSQEASLKALRARTLYTIGNIHCYESNDLSQRALEESIPLLRECGDLPTLSLALAEYVWSVQMYDQARSRALIEESLVICRQVGDPWNLAYVLWRMMCVAGDEGDDNTSMACGQESLALFREIGDLYYANIILAALGSVLTRKGQYTVGPFYLEEALIFFRDFGSSGGVHFSLTGLVEATYHQEDFHQMAACAQEALAISREFGLRGFEAGYLRNLGVASKYLGDLDCAAAYLLESLSIFQALKEENSILEALEGMAGIAAAKHLPLCAAHLLGAVEALFEPLAKKMRPMEAMEFNRDAALARAQLNEASFAAAWADGRMLSLEQAIQEAYTLKEPSPSDALSYPLVD